jgi:hypothetical protein
MIQRREFIRMLGGAGAAGRPHPPCNGLDRWERQ